MASSADSQSLPFDPLAATIADIHTALRSRQVSVRKIVNAYLSRIVALNPEINAMITLDPTALDDADNLDDLLTKSTNPDWLLKHKPLLGIPTILKDNFDCPPMSTTSGCLALKNCRPSSDASSVHALKQAGAVILGKANLHELAMEGLTVSSLGGQTLNPWDLTRTPGGSSGGCGAALAAGFCVLATGTDTVNSLRSPASANGVVSCRPTRGLVSRDGVVPYTYTQDVVGPMGKCVEDVALMLSVMSSTGSDPKDEVLASAPGSDQRKAYSSRLTQGDLRGLRLGLVESFFSHEGSLETEPVNDAMAVMRQKAEAAGAVVVPVTKSMFDPSSIPPELHMQRFEYAEQLTTYLQRPETGGNHPKSMSQLYSGHEYLVIPSQSELVKEAQRHSTSDREYQTCLHEIEELKSKLIETFVSNGLEALIYPEQSNLVVKVGSPSQRGRNGILAALTGVPVVAVPAGRSSPSLDAPKGVPIGMEVLGRPRTEERLLQIAYQIERLNTPHEYSSLSEKYVPPRDFAHVPEISSSREIPKSYPLGTLE